MSQVHRRRGPESGNRDKRTRTGSVRVTRRVSPGTLRSSRDGSLACLLLAPSPDWVAVDVETGALLRGMLGDPRSHPLLVEPPLTAVSLALVASAGAWDPSRPEAVAVLTVEEGASPTRRATRRLLQGITRAETPNGLLGGVGPSLPFVELRGDRPSVAVVSPAGGRARFTGSDDLTAHFLVGSVPQALPVSPGAAQWLRSGEVPTASSGAAARRRASRWARRPWQLGPGLEPTSPVLLVVGLGEPAGGQVRKLVLGVVPAI
jgi:hypothetical protein